MTVAAANSPPKTPSVTEVMFYNSVDIVLGSNDFWEQAALSSEVRWEQLTL